MKILVLNSGSSSVKFQLIETTAELIAGNEDHRLAHGEVEKIGTDDAGVSCEVTGRAGVKFNRKIPEHKAAIEAAVGCLMEPSSAVIRDPQEIEAIGHRVVHGGERFTQSVRLDDAVVKQLEELIDLAPLHNTPNLKGYYASRALFPDAQHVAVFDTAFHQTLAPQAFLYGLPYELYQRYQIRRYGFHGTSHRYVAYRFAQLHGRTRQDYKLITCHLGNGCSMCAIDHGKSVDTSMGFTPLEGLLMGTRSGDLDPAALLHVMSHDGLEIHGANSLLNEQSGLRGVSGVSNDMRTLLAEAGKGHERARLAINVFCYRAKKYIGAYLAAMNGADAVIFTGGIGENAPAIRAQICEGLSALGIVLNPARNDAAVGVERDLSAAGVKTQVWVIPTNEELLIARDTLRTLLGIPHP